MSSEIVTGDAGATSVGGNARLAHTFAACARAGRKALVVYLTYGDPHPAASVELMVAAAEAGADVIELGVPFSDPSADGPSIAAAMERALAQGAGLPGALRCVAEARARGCLVPIVLFGYYNPIVVTGVPTFAAACAAAGVDAVLTVDVPVDELAELAVPLAQHGVGVVPLLAPTSTPARVDAAAAFRPGFIYYISLTGVTGARTGALGDHSARAARVAALRAQAGVPIAVGFGVRSAADTRAVAAYADAVVVGSAIVERVAAAVQDGGGARCATEPNVSAADRVRDSASQTAAPVQAIAALVRELRDALK